MAEGNGRVLGWGTIVLTLLVTGVVVGVVLGAAGGFFGLSPSVTTGGVGVCLGVVAVFLIGRRQAALGRGK